MWNEEKKKDLETALSQIERQYGKGAIMRMDASQFRKLLWSVLVI